MPLYTNQLDLSLLPFQTGELAVQPLFNGSVALQTLDIFVTTQHEVRFPIITSDPSAAVYSEGQEITPDNVGTDEVVSVPTKIATAVVTSKEALADGAGIDDIISASVARSLGRALDQAVFNTVTGFAGLNTRTDFTKVSAGAAFDSLDPFVRAQYRAADYGTAVTAWIIAPEDAESIALLKDSEGSARNLLIPDSTEDGIITRLAGAPIVTSPAVPQGKVYGANSDYLHLVLREDINVYPDTSVFAMSQRVAIIGDIRASVASSLPASVVTVELDA